MRCASRVSAIFVVAIALVVGVAVPLVTSGSSLFQAGKLANVTVSASTPVPPTPTTEAEARAPTLAAAPPVDPTPPQATAFATSQPRTVFVWSPVDGQLPWPDDPASTVWRADDGYHLFARQPGLFVGLAIPLSTSMRTTIVSARFQKTGGPPGGGYGVIVRNQRSESLDGMQQVGQYYVLEAGDQGRVGIWRRDADRWVDLVPWTVSELVGQGRTPNDLVASAVGHELTLSVNGTEVARASDAVLEQGGAGIFVGGDLNQVKVTRLAVETRD